MQYSKNRATRAIGNISSFLNCLYLSNVLVFLWNRVVFGFPHVTHNRTDTYYFSLTKTLDYYSFLPSNMTHHMQVNVINRATIAHLAILGPVTCTDANPEFESENQRTSNSLPYDSADIESRTHCGHAIKY